MKVFKFGGASVKSADAVKNMASIVEGQTHAPLVIVMSAMGKMTNLLESIYSKQFEGIGFIEQINELTDTHRKLAFELLENQQRVDSIINPLIDSLIEILKTEYKSYSFGYDRVICFGELLSTTIIHSYLEQSTPNLTFVDARDFIVTNDNYQAAEVNWELTLNKMQTLNNVLKDGHIITQSFIGADQDGNSTSLGREGSDFTGAIFASLLKADSFTVWKDVDGILNADPKIISEALKFEELSYEETAEMAFYGAKVIHPKTIRPLANASIPLYVKPFLSPNESGTVIGNTHTEKSIPTIVFKKGQTLLSFKVEDFTFIQQHHLIHILEELTRLHIQVNLIQNSAMSFSVCVDSNSEMTDQILQSLGSEYSIYYNDSLQLVTVKNYDQQTIDWLSKDQEILLEQRSRHNYQIVIRL